jgi:hypothetical protein
MLRQFASLPCLAERELGEKDRAGVSEIGRWIPLDSSSHDPFIVLVRTGRTGGTVGFGPERGMETSVAASFAVGELHDNRMRLGTTKCRNDGNQAVGTVRTREVA